MNADSLNNRSKLISVAQMIVEESGDTGNFDAGVWIDNWLDQPMPALDWKKPVEYLHTDEGCELLARLLRQMQAGVFV